MTYLEQIEKQSAQVEQANEQALRARVAAEERETREIVKATTAKIMAIVGLASSPPVVSPPHRFQGHGNPDVYPGCVQCPYAQDHPVHV